jgi:CRP/FNR family transcriptional regulator, anaerobic regulatory protein
MNYSGREVFQDAGTTIIPTTDTQALSTTVGTVTTHVAKDTLFWEADPADYIFKVLRGTICLSKLLPDGRRQVARFCHAGDLVGLTANEDYPYTADALTDATTICIRKCDLDEELDANPAARESVLAAVQEELSAAQRQLMVLGRKNAMERVASFLIAMSEQAMRQGEDGSVVELPMTRVDIADYLGLTHETVCRTLSGLKKSGVVAISDPHRIELLQRDILEDIAEDGGERRYAA